MSDVSGGQLVSANNPDMLILDPRYASVYIVAADQLKQEIARMISRLSAKESDLIKRDYYIIKRALLDEEIVMFRIAIQSNVADA